jgi:hypothetical protein
MISNKYLQSPIKKALPENAVIVHEYEWSTMVPSDYCHYLMVNINYNDYLKFKDRLGFVKLPEDKYNILDLSGFDNNTPWWIPLDVNEIYYDPSMTGSQKAFMLYENGLMFYKESAGF